MPVRQFRSSLDSKSASSLSANWPRDSTVIHMDLTLAVARLGWLRSASRAVTGSDVTSHAPANAEEAN